VFGRVQWDDWPWVNAPQVQRPLLINSLTPLGADYTLNPLFVTTTGCLKQSRKAKAMPKVNPWHSVKQYTRNVHHDNTECTEGNNIEKEYWRAGTGGRPKCEHCADLDAKGK